MRRQTPLRLKRSAVALAWRSLATSTIPASGCAPVVRGSGLGTAPMSTPPVIWVLTLMSGLLERRGAGAGGRAALEPARAGPAARPEPAESDGKEHEADHG